MCFSLSLMEESKSHSSKVILRNHMPKEFSPDLILVLLIKICCSPREGAIFLFLPCKKAKLLIEKR